MACLSKDMIAETGVWSRPTGGHHGREQKQVSLREFSNPASETGNLPAGGVAMDDAFLRGAHDDGLGLAKRLARPIGIARGNGLFDLGHARAHAGPA